MEMGHINVVSERTTIDDLSSLGDCRSLVKEFWIAIQNYAALRNDVREIRELVQQLSLRMGVLFVSPTTTKSDIWDSKCTKSEEYPANPLSAKTEGGFPSTPLSLDALRPPQQTTPEIRELHVSKKLPTLPKFDGEASYKSKTYSVVATPRHMFIEKLKCYQFRPLIHVVHRPQHPRLVGLEVGTGYTNRQAQKPKDFDFEVEIVALAEEERACPEVSSSFCFQLGFAISVLGGPSLIYMDFNFGDNPGVVPTFAEIAGDMDLGDDNPVLNVGKGQGWDTPEDGDEVEVHYTGTLLEGTPASIVFKNEKLYSEKLVQVAQKLFEFATQDKNQGVYTQLNGCGEAARKYYNSSGYLDELVSAGTWLFFVARNSIYLQYTVHNFQGVVKAELVHDKCVLDWNNKLAANVVLLSWLRYFIDPGYPYETTLRTCSNITTMLMCSYLHLHDNFNMTAGGLILLRPSNRAPLQYAATTAFLAKLYKDYLHVMQILGGSCSSTESFSLQMLQAFSASQVGYILGDNPLKLSYLGGFGNKYPAHVHHRAASIPPDDQSYSSAAGKGWIEKSGWASRPPFELEGKLVLQVGCDVMDSIASRVISRRKV